MSDADQVINPLPE
jgi:hypothetical protein